MWNQNFWVILILASTALGNDVDLFSSMSDMQKLYEREQDLTVKLEDHLKTVETQIKAIDTLLDKYYSNYNYTEEDASEYVSHPINTFVLLKRTSLEWPKLKKILFDEKSEKQLDELIAAMELFPGERDLEGALNGIFLLHETYDLNLTAFSLGQIPVPGQEGKVIQSDQQLTAKDLELLAKLAFNRAFYDRAFEFLEASMWRAEYDKDAATLASAKATLKGIKRGHDETLVKKGPRGPTWKTFQVPFDKELAKKKKFKKITNKKYKPVPVLHESLPEHYLWDQFNALCRGERLRTPEQEKDLKSFFLHFGDPYLRLGPFKLSVMNQIPFVGIFHDFITEKETTAYINKAKDKLVRSEHQSKTGGTESSIKRTSKQTWLSDQGEYDDLTDSLEEALDVSKRIKLATRMNVFVLKGGEPFQVANYGIGGVYNHHTDAAGEFSEHPLSPPGDGDRIATFMGYLSDVEAGGATVFPSLGVTSWPKKGDAVFWYNMDRNGRLDIWTHHGGCPVLKGSKWITNKWIRWYFQYNNFPCHLDIQNMHRYNPLSNDVCEMTDRCKTMDV